MLNNYICALDIGSSKISAIVAQVKGRNINNLYFATVPAKGVKKNLIADSIDTIDSLSQVLKELKEKSGMKIRSLYTNISGQGITTKHSRAIIPLLEVGNKVITTADIEKVSNQALILGSNIEEEIIHYIPFNYGIDTNNNLSEPLGLYSHKLEVDLYLICAKLSSLESITHVINRAGYEIRSIFFSGLVTSGIVFNEESKKGISLLCDLGSDITELLLFKEGILKSTQILPFGGNDLTLELAKELKIPFDLAEEIKKSYGAIGASERIGQDKEILLKENNLYKPIKEKRVSEIVTSKAKSICASLKNAVEKDVSCQEVNVFLVVGRAALQEGLLELLEQTLGTKVGFGRIRDPELSRLLSENNLLSGQKYLTYLACLGIIRAAIEKNRPKISATTLPLGNPVLRIINKAKEIYQEYF